MRSQSRAEHFASLFKKEAESSAKSYRQDTEKTAVSQLIADADLSAQQIDLVQEAIELAISESYYRVLLALDGEASLGDAQQQYSVLDDNGHPIYESGELEAAAWLYFHTPMKAPGSDT